MEQKDVADLFDKWNQALQTGDADQVTACYAPDAVLLPTVSPRIRYNPVEIRDYFVHFLEKKPVGKIIEENVRIFEDLAVHSGLYDFSVEEAGIRKTIPARFTFVYRKDEFGWRIIEHHSSVLPTAPPVRHT